MSAPSNQFHVPMKREKATIKHCKLRNCPSSRPGMPGGLAQSLPKLSTSISTTMSRSTTSSATLSTSKSTTAKWSVSVYPATPPSVMALFFVLLICCLVQAWAALRRIHLCACLTVVEAFSSIPLLLWLFSWTQIKRLNQIDSTKK